ncbi:hypothetical protein [Duncaniella freteri]|uniref:hypothetical protein n=1 Tax=Duncaniella freteri TaxID=2530391 RepID=UPI0025775A55|nr:hypothetical protein [Duncaniella freteri]
MEKRYGAAGPQNGLYKAGKNKWDIFYGFGKDTDDAEHGYNWYHRFDHRPSLSEIKEMIVATIKEESEYRLKYGIKWNGFTVEYSETLKTDLIGIIVGLQGGIMSFPQKINLGSNPDGTPNTYVFNDIVELGSLAGMVGNHRSVCSDEEWEAINALGEMEEYIEEQ